MQATTPNDSLRLLGSINFNTSKPDYKTPIAVNQIQNEATRRWILYALVIRVVKLLARLPIVCHFPIIKNVFHLFSKVEDFKKNTEDYRAMQLRTTLLGSDTINAKIVNEFEEFKQQNPDWFQGENLSVYNSKYSDSLKASEDFVELTRGSRVLSNIVTINYANAVHPGGAAMWGGHGSQEESLFRETLLYASIDPEANPELQHQIENVGITAHRHIPYFGGIYSPDVPRTSSFSKKHTFLSIAACDLRPQHLFIRSLGQHANPERLFYNNSNGTINWDQVQMRTKWMLRISLIEMIQANIKHLQSAHVPPDQIKKQRIDTIILGGFGCGAFNNDPKQMAQWIVDVLREPIFKGVFNQWIIPQGTSNEDTSQYYENSELLDFEKVKNQKLSLQPYIREAFEYAVKMATNN